MENLKFLGIGGATNIELGGNSCYIKDKSNLLIIDACESATEKLKSKGTFDDIKNIFIVITHTHFDHIAGLGVLIWYSNFNLNITPKIIFNDCKNKRMLRKILKLTGVDEKLFEFINASDFKMGDISLKMQTTSHTPKLQCYGIMFEDKNGKYYYTGDTNDIRYIKRLCEDSTIKTIYTEVATETYGVHIKYDDLKDLNKDKLVLMHFDTMELYRRAISDQFNVADIN